MIAPLTTLLAAVKAAGVVAHVATVMPPDLPGLPALVVGHRGLENFRFNESGETVRADGYAELYLVSRLLHGGNGKPDPDASTEADTLFGALVDVMPAHGFRPVRSTQVEAHWGRHEVIVCQLRVFRPDAVRVAPLAQS